VRQTLMWFLEHNLQAPTRNARGETCWKRPVYRSMHRVLTSPIYGGAYCYGKTEHLIRYDGGKTTPSAAASQGNSGWPSSQGPMKDM